MSGCAAWLLWLEVHLSSRFGNRLAVLYDWTVAFVGSDARSV